MGQPLAEGSHGFLILLPLCTGGAGGFSCKNRKAVGLEVELALESETRVNVPLPRAREAAFS